MAAGLFSGPAKNALLVVVKSDVDDGSLDLFVYMTTIQWVMNDVFNKNRQGSAVLSMSHGSSHPPLLHSRSLIPCF